MVYKDFCCQIDLIRYLRRNLEDTDAHAIHAAVGQFVKLWLVDYPGDWRGYSLVKVKASRRSTGGDQKNPRRKSNKKPSILLQGDSVETLADASTAYELLAHLDALMISTGNEPRMMQNFLEQRNCRRKLWESETLVPPDFRLVEQDYHDVARPGSRGNDQKSSVPAQLTYFFDRLINRISAREMLVSADKRPENTAIQRLTNYWNYLTIWVQKMVLEGEEKDSNARMIIFILKVCKYLEMSDPARSGCGRNFSVLGAIVAALLSNEVFRLKDIWATVPKMREGPAAIRRYEMLRELYSAGKNWKNLKERIHEEEERRRKDSSPRPMLPHIPIKCGEVEQLKQILKMQWRKHIKTGLGEIPMQSYERMWESICPVALCDRVVTTSNIHVGLQVKRGPDWLDGYQDEDGGEGEWGTVLSWQPTPDGNPGLSPGYCDVKWHKAEIRRRKQFKYRIGADMCYDLRFAEGSYTIEPVPVMQAAIQKELKLAGRHAMQNKDKLYERSLELQPPRNRQTVSFVRAKDDDCPSPSSMTTVSNPTSPDMRGSLSTSASGLPGRSRSMALTSFSMNDEEEEKESPLLRRAQSVQVRPSNLPPPAARPNRQSCPAVQAANRTAPTLVHIDTDTTAAASEYDFSPSLAPTLVHIDTDTSADPGPPPGPPPLSPATRCDACHGAGCIEGSGDDPTCPFCRGTGNQTEADTTTDGK